MKRLLLTLVLLLLPTGAFAALCGPGQVNPTCLCGDTVVGAYTMPAPLVCATGHGLRVASGANLNCNNHAITGATVTDTYGIYLDGTQGATVRSCTAQLFFRGIRLNGAHNNLIKNSNSIVNGNTTLHTGYGVDLAGGSSMNIFRNVKIYGNADEGIHFGSNAQGNRLELSEICGNFRENVYVLENRDTEVLDNTIGHDCFGFTASGNSVYAKHVNHTYFLRNVFNKISVHITGATNGTLFMSNTFNTNYDEDCYAPDGTCPAGTLFVVPAP